ncbi:hypothetical protein AMELA_G00048460 [Ameiurus melas]|uniref:Uncharacterized protein n=1 Tax=Ameiurus melas TaxID=219545 RepID=A0A7J6B6X5_AMEME|nr:hypothetical protein AMELA_G00048460 [Ameiurus melas]
MTSFPCKQRQEVWWPKGPDSPQVDGCDVDGKQAFAPQRAAGYGKTGVSPAGWEFCLLEVAREEWCP